MNLASKYKTDRQTIQRNLKKKIPKESSLFLWLVKNHDDWSKWLMTFTPYILSFPEHKKQSHPQIWCAWNTQSEMVCLKGVIKAYLRFIWERKRNGKKPYPLSIDKSEKIELQKRHAPMPVLSRLYISFVLHFRQEGRRFGAPVAPDADLVSLSRWAKSSERVTVHMAD